MTSHVRALFLLTISIFAAAGMNGRAESATEAAPAHVLRQIVISHSMESAQQLSAVPGGGFVFVDPPLLP